MLCNFLRPQADLSLNKLGKRIDEFEGIWLNSNMPTFPHSYPGPRRGQGPRPPFVQLPSYDVVENEAATADINCGDRDSAVSNNKTKNSGDCPARSRHSPKLGVLGMLSDEPNLFADGTFKGKLVLIGSDQA